MAVDWPLDDSGNVVHISFCNKDRVFPFLENDSDMVVKSSASVWYNDSTGNRNVLYFRLDTKKPSHHGEKASLFTGKFERAIDLSFHRQAMINQFMEERMDAVALLTLIVL